MKELRSYKQQSPQRSLRTSVRPALETTLGSRFELNELHDDFRWGDGVCNFRFSTENDGAFVVKVLEGEQAYDKLSYEQHMTVRARSAHPELAYAIPEIVETRRLPVDERDLIAIQIRHDAPGILGLHISDPGERAIMWEATGRLLQLCHEHVAATSVYSDSQKKQLITNFSENHIRTEHRELLDRFRVISPKTWPLWEERLNRFAERAPMPTCFCHTNLHPTNISFDRIKRQVFIVDWGLASDSQMIGNYRDFVDYGVSDKDLSDLISLREGYGIDERAFLESGDARDVETFQIAMHLPYAIHQIKHELWIELERTREAIRSLIESD